MQHTNPLILRVRQAIDVHGGDQSKISDEQIKRIAGLHSVPQEVTEYEPGHPVFGTLGDGHILRWLADHPQVLALIIKIVLLFIGV